MQAELETKLEFKKMVFTYVQTIRCSKKRPELSRAAIDDEIRLKNEISELEEELERVKQVELPLVPQHESAA